MENRLPLATSRQKLKRWFGFRRLRALEVTGNSMAPVVRDGDVVLYDPLAVASVGDIVLVSHPYMHSVRLLKRVREIDADGKLFLVGDNETESTDSRTLGWFSPSDMRGKIICRLK